MIVGIYDKLIGHLSTMLLSPTLLRNSQGRTRLLGALQFLLPLGIGIVLAYFFVTKWLVGPEENPGLLVRFASAPICYGFLFGVVLASIKEPWRRIPKIHGAHWLIAAAFALLAAWFSGLPHLSESSAGWLLALGGAGAICMMLLPGVSGSLFLVIIGQYTVVTRAIHDRQIALVSIFVAGIVLGVICFVPLLRWLLVKARGITMAALTGLMAGSLRALWPYKTSYVPKTSATNIGLGDNVVWVACACAIGIVFVATLSRFSNNNSTPRTEDKGL